MSPYRRAGSRSPVLLAGILVAVVALGIAAAIAGALLVARATADTAGRRAGQATATENRKAAEAATRATRQATYDQAVKRRAEVIAGCQRSKADRTAIATALAAQADYLELVLAARSVKADVKAAARVAQVTFRRTASSLESRTGRRLICAKEYPVPLAPPGVTPVRDAS